MKTVKASTFSDWLTGFIAGPELGEAIAGDLREFAYATTTPRLSLAIATAKSLPGLLSLGLSNVSVHRLRIELGWLSILLAAAWTWEVKIAQTLAWPMASSLSTISPFSIVITCKLAYLALFALGLVVLMGIWRVISLSDQTCWRLRAQRLGAACVAGLIPVLYLLAFPGPYDGHPAFRFAQLGLVGLIGVTVIIASRKRLHWA